MKKTTRVLLLTTMIINFAMARDQAPEQSNGINYPKGWQNWSVIAVSHRTDNNTLRAILGNDMAVNAARSGQINPWPDGAVIAKVVWKEGVEKEWKTAISPKQLVHTEFMFKDSQKYTETFGWGWARWIGMEQKPYNEGSVICTSCHTPVKNKDWVYTQPAEFPLFE